MKGVLIAAFLVFLASISLAAGDNDLGQFREQLDNVSKPHGLGREISCSEQINRSFGNGSEEEWYGNASADYFMSASNWQNLTIPRFVLPDIHQLFF